MGIEKAIANVGEYPVFIGGTCAEEAVWLLGYNRETYKSKPTEVYAFPIYKGFLQTGTTPIKQIPENYSLQKLRDEVLFTYGLSGEKYPSLFNYGDESHDEEFIQDKKRLGVILYFSPRVIITTGYEQDQSKDDRLEKLCSVRIPIADDFDPCNICLVEPMGPTDHEILRLVIPKSDTTNRKKILRHRFKDINHMLVYADYSDNITIGDGTFPK